MFIFVLALVPAATTFVSPDACLALLLAALFGYNLSRAISTAGWLPWISALIPERGRGRYLVRDAACVNSGSFLVFLIAAAALGSQPRLWHFSLLFVFSAVMGAASLFFLKRIPDVQAPHARSTAHHPVPWLAMVRFPPFRSLLCFVVTWSLAYGGLNTFTVTFLKMMHGLPESQILLLNSMSFVGGLSSLWFLGSRLDHLGSKPVIIVSVTAWMGVIAGWILLAGKTTGVSAMPMLVGLQVAISLFAALVTMANMRLLMGSVPQMGRDHFFAMYSVITSLALGLSPILWGVLLDALARHAVVQRFALEWNRFTFFFVAVSVVLFASLVLAFRLHEPKAAGVEQLIRDVLARPRFLLRLWPRQG